MKIKKKFLIAEFWYLIVRERASLVYSETYWPAHN